MVLLSYLVEYGAFDFTRPSVLNGFARWMEHIKARLMVSEFVIAFRFLSFAVIVGLNQKSSLSIK